MRSFLWLVLTVLVACSVVRGERPSMLFAPSVQKLASDPEILKRRLVFIYYIADVRPSFGSDYEQHLNRILRALDLPEKEVTAEDRFLDRVRQLILYDLGLLQRGADMDVTALKNGLCGENKDNSVDLIFFQNSAASYVYEGKFTQDVLSSYEVYRSLEGGRSTKKVIWEIPNLQRITESPRFEAQVLSHAAIFDEALKAVKREFPVDKHRFILMFKARGDNEHFARLQYPFDTAKIDSGKIRAAFLKRASEFGKPNELESFPLRADLSPLVHEILAEVLPPLKNEVGSGDGLSKFQLLETLAAWGGGDIRRGMVFSEVIFDTTRAPLENSTALSELVTQNSYEKLAIDNIAAIRHFGNSGAFPIIHFDKMFEFSFAPGLTASDKSFEVRLGGLMNYLQKRKGDGE